MSYIVLQSTDQKLHPGGQGYHQHSSGSADSNTDRSTGTFDSPDLSL